MDVVVCPHCKSHRIVSARVPRDVIVVMPCPACGELVVLFRKKVIALSRKILEHGTLEERKMHLASVIAEFLEPGMFGFPSEGDESEAIHFSDDLPEGLEEKGPSWLPPISEKELEKFTKIQLEKLDDSKYFRKHFG